MTRTKWFFLIIISFGAVYFYARSKAKKQSQITNKKIMTSQKLTFDINELVKALGGVENLIKVDGNISFLKIYFKNSALINIGMIKKTKAKGIMMNPSYLTLVYGDNSSFIAKKINDLL